MSEIIQGENLLGGTWMTDASEGEVTHTATEYGIPSISFFTPKQAREVADALRTKADEAEKIAADRTEAGEKP